MIVFSPPLHHRGFPKQLSPFKDRFAFVWDAERVSMKRPTAVHDQQAGLSLTMYRTKSLRKVWRRGDFQAEGWSRHNTIIVDDTPENFMNNYGNGIPIPAYQAWAASDEWLPRLRAYIESWGDVEDVRPIEKRFWAVEGKSKGWWGLDEGAGTPG